MHYLCFINVALGVIIQVHFRVQLHFKLVTHTPSPADRKHQTTGDSHSPKLRLTNFVMYTAFQVPDCDPALLLFHFRVIVQYSIS